MKQIDENLIKKHKVFFQSIAIFPGWLLMIYSCILAIPALLMIFLSNTFLGIDIMITLVGLFILGLFTVREKRYNFFGWASLTLSIGVLLFTIPNGIYLIYIFIFTGLVTIFSYLGFAFNKTFSNFAYLWSVALLIIFISHVLVLSSPNFFGLDVQGNELLSFTEERKKEIAEMDTVEFSRTDDGREIAVRIYDVSIFTTSKELEGIISNNPEPLVEFQKSILQQEFKVENNPYNYILNIYLHTFFNNKRIKL